MARVDTRNRVGIVGSVNYYDKIKVKDFIFKLKNEFKNNLVIVSGGRKQGADPLVKKYALDFSCEYKEFNPAHTPYNLYSVLAENYYGKNYSPRYFFHRNKLMIDYIDYLVIFIAENEKDNKDIDHVIEEAKKQNVKHIIIT